MQIIKNPLSAKEQNTVMLNKIANKALIQQLWDSQPLMRAQPPRGIQAEPENKSSYAQRLDKERSRTAERGNNIQ